MGFFLGVQYTVWRWIKNILIQHVSYFFTGARRLILFALERVGLANPSYSKLIRCCQQH